MYRGDCSGPLMDFRSIAGPSNFIEITQFFQSTADVIPCRWSYSPRINDFRSGLEGNGCQFIQTIVSLLLVTVGHLPFIEMNRLTVLFYLQCSDGHFDPLPDIFLS